MNIVNTIFIAIETLPICNDGYFLPSNLTYKKRYNYCSLIHSNKIQLSLSITSSILHRGEILPIN